MIHQHQKNPLPNGRYGLVKYDAACLAIKDASDTDEVLAFLAKADAMRVYGRQIQNTELQNRAALIRIRAQYRLGELLAETERNDGGDRGRDAGPRSPKTLKQLGVTKQQASICQHLAAIPEDKIDATLAGIAMSQREATTAAVLQMA